MVAAALAVCAACGRGGRGTEGGDSAGAPAIVRSPGATSAAARPPAGTAGTAGSADAYPVNRGTQGMRATVRWVLSPDRRAILVVEDAVSVEAEALPDGFFYASEATGMIVQMDSVWDVAPSPDWTRLAYGRAYVLRGGEQDSIPLREWKRVEAQLPADVGEATLERLYAELKARARMWALYRDTLGGTTDSSRFLRVGWVEGPTMELASPAAENLRASRAIAIDAGSVDVRDDTIRITTRTRDGRVTVRSVGPGTPLAATASGRFIVALARRVDAKPHEMRFRTIVYHVGPE